MLFGTNLPPIGLSACRSGVGRAAGYTMQSGGSRRGVGARGPLVPGNEGPVGSGPDCSNCAAQDKGIGPQQAVEIAMIGPCSIRTNRPVICHHDRNWGVILKRFSGGATLSGGPA